MNGFTLTEILVVVLIMGILASVAVPQYYKTTEKSKANEAVSYLLFLKGSQDRYNAKYGAYCIGAVATCGIDVTPPTLNYFTAGAFVAGTPLGPTAGWKLTLTRNDDVTVYTQYKLTYDLFAATALTCSPASPNPCTKDLLPNAN
jgi:type IV pilus assembly protein PilE